MSTDQNRQISQAVRNRGQQLMRLMHEHRESLDPEQRVTMREEMRRRFGDCPRPPWCDGGPEKSGTDAKP